uniref:Uncharacterized protein n=1 Tax=Rhizophora mucronata TaxID=61149 RepID=A0A2P2Q1K9_RHIMU
MVQPKPHDLEAKRRRKIQVCLQMIVIK